MCVYVYKDKVLCVFLSASVSAAPYGVGVWRQCMSVVLHAHTYKYDVYVGDDPRQLQRDVSVGRAAVQCSSAAHGSFPRPGLHPSGPRRLGFPPPSCSLSLARTSPTHAHFPPQLYLSFLPPSRNARKNASERRAADPPPPPPPPPTPSLHTHLPQGATRTCK
jgi:hypothetical protein